MIVTRTKKAGSRGGNTKEIAQKEKKGSPRHGLNTFYTRNERSFESKHALRPKPRAGKMKKKRRDSAGRQGLSIPISAGEEGKGRKGLRKKKKKKKTHDRQS